MNTQLYMYPDFGHRLFLFLFLSLSLSFVLRLRPSLHRASLCAEKERRLEEQVCYQANGASGRSPTLSLNGVRGCRRCAKR